VHEMDGADGEDVVKQLEDIIEELKGKGSGEK